MTIPSSTSVPIHQLKVFGAGSSWRVILLCLFLGVVLSASVQADEKDVSKQPSKSITTLPRIPAKVHDLLQERKFDDAVKLIDGFLALANTRHADYLTYLKGRAQIESGKLEPANATFKSLIKTFPKSRWVSRARFGLADIHVRNRNYREAGLIYQAEAKRLLSTGRRDDLAGIYLEFADKYFSGQHAKDPSGQPQPDYAQALTYYKESLKLNPSLQTRQRVELQVAHSHRFLNQHKEAMAAYSRFLADYAAEKTPKEQQASAEQIIDAQFRLGSVQLAAGFKERARRTWQDFLASDVGKKSGAEKLAEAAYRLAHTYGIPAPATESDMELGIAAHERFLRQYPKSQLAPQASFEIAQSYMNRGRHEQAVERLNELITNTDAKAKQVPLARNMLGQAYAAQKKFTLAITAWKAFLDKHPSDSNWANVQRTVINTEFLMANAARADKKFEKARQLWSTFLNKYPLDSRAPQILFAFGDMKFAEAVARLKTQQEKIKNGVTAKPDDDTIKLFNEAIADWNRLVSKYPNTNDASRASFVIGATLEDQLGKLAEALEAYKKVRGQFQNSARTRIARLTQKQLEVVTERKFHTDEKARIKITTRNIKDVNVRIYRIDMISYFRKMHLATGVESLDIALIDPDKTWDHEVAQFEDYRRQESEIEIPVDGAGVTAVTVTGEKLEATTMVVVSDLDIVAKASRNELFVFAQNSRTGEPQPGVSLLISDGNEVFAEETTGENGVFQQQLEKLKTLKDLRVFAVHEGHAASTVNNLAGLSFAVGLSPKGFLFVDRPAYRAGQLVNLKGIIRWVADDQYTFKAGEKFQLDVYDARGRVIHTQEVALNQFGTVSNNFVLPESSPVGQYRVHLHQPGKTQSYEAQFQVHEFQLDSVRLNVELDKKIYFRGDVVKGTLTLKYYHGTPLANKTVKYRYSNREFTAKTDRKGRVKFEIQTRQFRENESIAVTATFPEKNITGGTTALLATRGFAIHVDTLRSVYIAGETFDASIKVSDPAGNPVKTPLKLEISERTRVNGRRGERLVEAFEINSDDKGAARRTLRIDESGSYILRATGTDQFGNQLSGSHVVSISGDDDRIRLRILADTHQYKVGDNAKVQLHWREGDALALITYEGASILGYQLVTLKKGANAVHIPMDAKLAPNFNLAVSVMHGSRFHEAASEFRVQRKLNIKLKPNQTKLKPGQELVVDVTTTNPQGEPVPTEVSLALIQQNLLNMFGDNSLAAIEQFFGAEYRQPQVRAVSSCTFLYKPATNPVNEFLIAEEGRAQAVRNSRRALVALQRARADREVAELSVQLDDLITQGRQAEADRIAKYANSIAPGNTVALKMQQKADLGRRFVGNSARADLFAALEDVEARWDDNGNGSPPLQPGTNALTDGVSLSERSLEGARIAGVAPQRANEWSAMPFAAATEDFLVQQEQAAGSVITRGRYADTARLGERLQQIESLYDDFGLQQRKQIADQRKLEEDYKSLAGLDRFSASLNLTVRAQEQIVPEYRRAVDSYFENLAQAKQTIVGKNSRGEFFVMNNLKKDEFERIVSSGVELMPQMANSELGYWNPNVVTDEKGKARITLQLPERSSAWTLQARGVDADAMTGRASVDIVSRKDLFAILRTAPVYTHGDEVNIQIEVHNSVVKKGEDINVVFRSTIGDETSEVRRQVKSIGPGVLELSFPIALAGNAIDFDLTIAAGELSDTVKQTVPVRPFGVEVFATASGSSNQSTIAFVKPPAGLAIEDASLELLIGPSINRSLVEVVLGVDHSILSSRWSAGIERSISDILGGVSLLKVIKDNNTDAPESTALASRVRSGVARLVSSQRNDGAWSWSGRHSAPADRYITSRAVWALSLAQRAGFNVPSQTFNQSVARLKSFFTASSTNDREGQAIILHGLAHAKAVDFAFANRLYRERNNLSVSGLLHVALTLIELDRKQMALDLLELVDLPTESPNGRTKAVLQCVPWMQSGVELRSLHLLALEALRPNAVVTKQTADWLMSARTGFRWSQEKANGPAVVALSDWFSRSKFTAEKYSLEIKLNGKDIETIEFDPALDDTRRIHLPAKMLVANKEQQISFTMKGQGTFSYSAILAGSVAANEVKSSTDDWRVFRYIEPAHRMLNGETIPRGFNILTGRYETFRNPVTQLPVGDRAEVTLHVNRYNVTGGKDEQLDYLVLTEPIPSGAVVLEESIRGSYERYELTAGNITFYLGATRYVKPITYTLAGNLSGKFKTTPTVVRSFYRPDRVAVSKPTQLEILAQGEKTKDAYQLTPVELYEFGKRHLAQGDNASSSQFLSELFTEWRLNAQVYKHVVEMLFRTTLAIDQHDAVVRYFEIIKEKYPDVEIDFASIMKVANAYQELGEYERSYLVYRATIESAFERENQITGFLDQRGEFVRSVEVMERFLREYPAEPYISVAMFALAGEVYTKAAQCSTNNKLKDAGLTDVDLISSSIRIHNHILSTWPNDPAADRVSFSMASAVLDLEEFGRTIELCESFAKRYPKSPLLDSFWYVIGYSQFALGKHDDALAMCKKVSEATRKDERTGAMLEAANKWQAIYIMGQIYHSLGQPANAILQYKKVKGRFSDAAEAIEFFSRQSISVPEVSTVKPGSPGKVELKFRNIRQANVKVYRIDLLKFGLMQRNLNRITAINLAGIRPYHEATTDLGDGNDYRDRTQDLKLPLKEEGAYLVVVRGDNLYASGLVLVSPLTLEVQEDATSGRVRVTVKNSVNDKYLRNVLVKVIGSSNKDFKTGDTDLRGIFIADNIRGTSTIIARAEGDRYAFHRGKTHLGPATEQAPQSPRQQGGEKATPQPAPSDSQSELLRNVLEFNGEIQKSNSGNFRNLLDNTTKGVKAKAAY